MPFYEYECPSCKFYAEVLQKISDKPLKKCSSCGKTGFKRLISAPVFRLKGSGWYETDFKGDKDNKRNLAGAEREETKPATDAKADDKADAKTADAKTADANKAGAETSKTESAAPAKTDKVEKTGSDSKSGSESATSSSAKRSGSSSAKSSSKSAPTRSTKRPTKVVARGRRRR